MSTADASMRGAWGFHLHPRSPYSAEPPTDLAAPATLRERAYRLARQELPDAPVEDVMCRAERIAIYLKGEPAPKKLSE